MTQKKTRSNNIIRVDFRKSKQDISLKSLYPEAFAMYVDTESDHPDDFSKAVLETLKEQKDAVLKATNPKDSDDD